MPQQIRAVVVDPSVPGRLAIREVSLRDPDRDEVGHRHAPAGVAARPLPTGAVPNRTPGLSASCHRELGLSA